MADGSTGRVGRPSLALERRQQILSAFIDLVAQWGLDRVTLDEVAEAAGVRRAALRHFVGNRDALILGAIDEIYRRYRASVTEHVVGDEPTIDELINQLFSAELTREHSVEYQAFSALHAEAVRRTDVRAVVRGGYDALGDDLAAALRREYPAAPIARIRDTAYVLLCLLEQNTNFQQLGYPRARNVAARNAARLLVSDLSVEFDA